jgi:hypothetical protein
MNINVNTIVNNNDDAVINFDNITTKTIDFGTLKIDGMTTTGESIQSNIKNNFIIHKESIPAENPSSGCIEKLTFKDRYRMNAAVVTVSTVGMNVLVRLFGDNRITGSKANGNGLPLVTLMLPASFIGAAMKGNWRDVGSQREQFYVLLCYMLLSAGSDALSSLISDAQGDEDASVIGQTTLVAASNALGYLTKMAASGAMGLPTYTQNAIVPNLDGIDLSKKKKMCYALLGALSTITAVASHYLESDSSAGIMINSSFSQCFNKVGKTLLKVEDSKGAKLKAAAACTATAVLVSVIVGAAFPLTPSATTLEAVGKAGFHFFGPASGIAATSLITNLGCRALEKKKKSQANQPVAKTIPSFKKKAINGLAFVGTTAAAATMHAVNNVLLSGSKIIGLGTKLFQMGWTYHATREIMKGLKDRQKLVVLGAELALSAAVEAAADAICPTASSRNWNYPTATIVAAVGARFLGKMIRERFLPKATVAH